MIIFIGGFPGSGNYHLGAALARSLGFCYYPVGWEGRSGLEMRLLFLRSGDAQEMPPLSDDARERIAKQVAAELPLLSKMHAGIVVCSPLVRESSRSIMFDAARRIGPTLTVWIESIPLKESATFIHRPKNLAATARIQKIEKELRVGFDPFTEQPFIFRAVGTRRQRVAAFRKAIASEISQQ